VNRLFRLGPVLRARKAQEDAARGAVIQSRAQIRDAQALAKRRSLDLAGSEAPSEGTARAMVASMVARQSLAATLSGAHRLVAEAEEVTQVRIAELTDAAKRRRAVEKMAERHAETVRVTDLKTDQANIDELAVTMKARNAARGLDGQTEQRSSSLRTGLGTAADREVVSRGTALSVHATRTAGWELVPAAEALAARRADLRTSSRIVDAPNAEAPAADLQGETGTDENWSRA